MAPNNISPDLANLLALVFEWGVYGASLPFFGVTLHELFRREKGEKINKTLVFVALALWLLSTTTLVGDTTNTFLRFTTFRDVPDYFQQVAGRPAMILRGFAYMCITILADAVVVYRCFVVWRSSHWVVRSIPWLLWFGLIAAGVSCWVTLFTARPENAPSMYRLTRFTTAFFAASLVANLLSTGLLAYKIWRITDALSASNSTLRKLARVVIDSGVIYTASLVIALIVLLSGSNLYYVTTYIVRIPSPSSAFV
ncbi:hypothetical protein VNI00_017189 [Paramarasmius palmivorus]|uniref:Uncharacterized protein n=1 Tax=Paramarasmius palmivorus TaxID=297713 RepID=A0AAW0B883_9AGAR